MLEDGLHRHLVLICNLSHLLRIFIFFLEDLWQVGRAMHLALGALVRDRLRRVITVHHILFVYGAAVISSLHGLHLPLQLLCAACIDWRDLIV